ncbi:7101_t:CDS:10 [Funneliformis mosseae]|uniref:Histone acetyltransferase type B catalytic subunit n=1 Tax=Funneliformis mosseae TaxID=27381 RepID=A0A9N8YN86_FUNMO|nr:7101_t:CDS:10 [Funneliformis mosseae]
MVYYFTCKVVDPPALIYMGKNMEENEDLIKHGWEEDVWYDYHLFHVHPHSSAHVYLRLQSGQSWENIPQKLLEDLGQLTKDNSIKGCKENNVTILYTPWSNLLKTNDMATGEVSFRDQNKVKKMQVKTKNNKIINRLEKTRIEKFPDLEKEKLGAEKERRRIARETAIAKEQEELRLEQDRKNKEAQKSYDSLFDESNMRSNYDSNIDLEDDFITIVMTEMVEELFKPQEEEWLCNSNAAVSIWFVEPSTDPDQKFDSVQVSPTFTYSIFGHKEQIYGYKNLEIVLKFASGSLATYFDVQFTEKIPDVSSKSIADNVIDKMKEFIPNDYITNYDTFLKTVDDDAYRFKPMGEKITEYRLEQDEDEDKVYEIYKTTFETPRFKEYHRRFQIMVLFYIEAATYIDEDEKWETMLLFEKKRIGDKHIYGFVGFCTMYNYYFYNREKNISTENNINDKVPNSICVNEGKILPEDIRLRISQFLIFPHFQGKGHGSKLYQTIYQYVLSNSRIKELAVEIPNESFEAIRDKNDLRYLREHKVFEGLVAPVDKKAIESIRRNYKLNKRQLLRCLEIELLRKLNKMDAAAYKAYRLQVKERLYNWNKEILKDVDRAERIGKLEETFKGLIEEYHEIILKYN